MRRNSLFNFVRPSIASAARRRSDRAGGFTLVEILIVVIILGILASIVVPQFSGAARTARETTLRDDLRFLRTQVEVFRAQHRDVAPGYPGGNTGQSPTEEDFADQMLRFTSDHCDVSNTADEVHRFGPYLSRLPSNPLNDRSSILVVANGGEIPTDLPVMNGDEEFGWIYKPQTQQWVANVAGTDANGVPFASY